MLADAKSSVKFIIIVSKTAIESPVKGKPVDTIMREFSFSLVRPVPTHENIKDFIVGAGATESVSPKIRWGQVKKYFKSRGHEITQQGGDKFITEQPKRTAKPRNIVRVGHKHSCSRNATVARPFLSAIERLFGVTPEHILSS